MIHLPLAMGLWAGTVVRTAATWACSESSGDIKHELERQMLPLAVHIWPRLGEGRAQRGKRLESHSHHGYLGSGQGGARGPEVAGWGLEGKLSGQPHGPRLSHSCPPTSPTQNQAPFKGKGPSCGPCGLKDTWEKVSRAHVMPVRHPTQGGNQAPRGGPELEGTPGQAGQRPEPRLLGH